MKRCKCCGIDKPKSEIWPDKRKASGLSDTCVVCKKDYHKKYKNQWKKEKLLDADYRLSENKKQKERRAKKVFTEEERMADRIRSKNWRKNNPEKVNKSTREYKRRKRQDAAFRAVEAIKKKAYRAENRDAHMAYMKDWHLKNEDAQIEYRTKYRKENSEYFTNYRKVNAGKINAKTRKRQTALMKRTPVWLDDVDYFEMECIYTYCSALRAIGLDYHVDHEIPLQGKKVSGLHVPSNLRVIHASENLKKSNRFEV